MSLAAGAKLGPYEIVSPLGAGAMGEVYRAKETRLGRDMALKILPKEMSAEDDGLGLRTFVHDFVQRRGPYSGFCREVLPT
jgi:serine/threonine protein kinase